MKSVIVKELKARNPQRMHYGLMEASFEIGCAFQFEGMQICKNHIDNNVYVRKLGKHLYIKDERLEKNFYSSLDQFFNLKPEVSSFLSGVVPGEKAPLLLSDLRLVLCEPLEIPVFPIIIENIQCRKRSGPITAIIKFCDSIAVSNVPIYDMVSNELIEQNFIKSIEIKNFVHSLLKDEEVINEARNVFEIGHEISTDFEHSSSDR